PVFRTTRRRGTRRERRPSRRSQDAGEPPAPRSRAEATLVVLNRTLLSSLGAVLGFLGIAGPAPAQRGDNAFRSAALGGKLLRFESYLPSDYATSGKRYPVVYFLHGLPSAGDAYRQLRFVEDALAAV